MKRFLKQEKFYLAHTGLETDLIFNRNIDLPGFAAFPLLDNEDGRLLLIDYYESMFLLGKEAGVGVIAETVTWMANKDRASFLGYDDPKLSSFNYEAVKMVLDVRDRLNSKNVVVSGNLGPQSDGYLPENLMSAEQAKLYHKAQINDLVSSGVDLVSAYTLCYPDEAIGIVEAAKEAGASVVISFTVETDGKLPIGMSLKEAIEAVDLATRSYADYFMINCAHPDHLESQLSNEPWFQRVKGLVVNASRCSHTELDEAKELDSGNPTELASQLVDIVAKHPHIRVVGGCCGTDLEHLKKLAERISTVDL